MADELPAEATTEEAATPGTAGGAECAAADVVVANPQGLHLRPATEFARVAQASGCRVRVRYGDNEGDGASVLELAMMAIRPGARLRIEAHGADCERALAELVALVAAGGTG